MRFSLLPASALLTFTLQAQWTTPDQNTPVSDVTGVGAATPLSAAGPEGSTYATWFENATGQYVLKMQRLDVDGNTMWSPGGIVVSAEDQNTALFRYDLKSDHAGNAIVAFQDMRSGVLDVVAYKIGPNGLHQWPGGVPLLTPGATGLAPSIGVLSDDRIVFTWNTSRSPATVAYQLFETNGTTSGFPLEIGGTGITGRPKVVATSDGGFWLQYVHQSGNFLSPGTMYAVRCDAMGVAGPPIVIAANTITGFYFPEPVPDGQDGLYVAFNTGNVANGNLTDVCVQRLRADGTTWSNTGVPVEDGVMTQRYTGTATPVLMGDNGVMLAYQVTDLNQSEGGISVQRFDPMGGTLLGTTGPVIVTSSSALPQVFGNAAIPDGMVAAFTLGGFGLEVAHAARVDLNGEVYMGGPLIDLCVAQSGKDDATLVPFTGGQAVAVWQDERNGSTIYAQPVQLDFNTGTVDATEGDIVLLGGEAPALLFGAARDASVLRITDPRGRLFHEQRLGPQPQGARVHLPLQGATAGVYLVTIEGAGQRSVHRLVR